MNPFRLGISPNDAITQGPWGDIADTAMSLLLSSKGLNILLGPSGIGKTLLLREVERRLLELGRHVVFLRDGTDALAPGLAAGVFASGPDWIVLIDEVKATEGVLQALPGLARLRCLLAGQPDLEPALDTLGTPPATLRLMPLNDRQAADFVQARLSQAAHRSPPLETAALERLVESSGGIPRTLCTVGGGALYLATAADSEVVTASHVDEALEFGGFRAPAARIEAASLPLPPPPEELAAPVIVGGAASLFAAVEQDRLHHPPKPAPKRRLWPALLLLALAGIAAGVWMTVTHPRAKVASPTIVAPPTIAAAEPITPPPPAATAERSPTAAAEVAPLPPKPVSSTRLVVSYPSDSAPTAAPAAQLGQALQHAGFVVGEPLPTPSFLGSSGLDVFYIEDRDAAEALRTALGRTGPPIHLVPPTRNGPQPRPGTIGLVLAADAPFDDWIKAAARAPAVAVTEAPDAGIERISPADGATLKPRPNREIVLTWNRPTGANLRNFVEVQNLDETTPVEVSAGFAEQDAVTVKLGPTGTHFAWRVHVVRWPGGRYRSSRWFRFDLGAASPN